MAIDVKGLFGRVISTVRSVIPGPHESGEPVEAVPPPTTDAPEPETSQEVESPRVEPVSMRHDEEFAIRTEGQSAIVWQTAPESLERARALLEQARTCLRIVRVAWPLDSERPRVRVIDQPDVGSQGRISIEPIAVGERLVVSFGIVSAGRFVSIEHRMLPER